MADTSAQTSVQIPFAVRILAGTEWVLRHWLGLWIIIFTVFNVLPILAPVAMHTNQTAIGNGIYDLYGRISHQWAHRSYFMFGEQVSYSVQELPVTLVNDFFADGTELYLFIGNEELGWKIAWSDRLLSMFGAALVTTFVYMVLRKRRGFQPLTWTVAVYFVLPLLIDGATHIISENDAVALVDGARWTNDWLVSLTGSIFSPEFYVGDQVGTFNSWMRILTGGVAGIGIMAWGLGVADNYFARNATILRERLDNWWQRQQS